MVTESDSVKEFLFDKLYIWAKNKALTKTKQCYRNTKKNSILNLVNSKKVWRFRHIFVAFSEYANFMV